ncbi:hypothetical protein ACFU5O_16510 [Streptomyces sp. NPDC057445]|uniref:hypothetical protein n=1 Tax=Streptomyces sp. NPDC057445 TaxID=3346136 RepID=UPI0036CDF1BA
MVLTGETDLVRHRVPSRAKLITLLVAAGLLGACLAALLVRQYNDRPPWGDDVAYEGGYIVGNRVRQTDMTGERTKALLSGGCARAEAEGRGGRRATHNQRLWVAGCVDGAAGRQSTHQGLVR